MTDEISKDVTEEYGHLAELFALLPALNKESARGATLIMCSHADVLLERIIRAFLLDNRQTERLLTGFNAPLGTFSARISAARSFSLITQQEHDELDRLRRVRNEFAHRVHCTFRERKVIDLCKGLMMAAEELAGSDESEASIARAAFSTSGVKLIAHLTNRATYVGRQKITDRTWPT